MNERLCRALLGFYNQTYHGLTMSAGLRGTGSPFWINSGLASNMLVNVREVLDCLEEPEGHRFEGAWKQVEKWLDGLCLKQEEVDHGSALFELNKLTYTTWITFCDHPKARHYAAEHYTVVAHPDEHPGITAIKDIWINTGGREGHSAIPATLSNLAALTERRRSDEKPPAPPEQSSP